VRSIQELRCTALSVLGLKVYEVLSALLCTIALLKFLNYLVPVSLSQFLTHSAASTTGFAQKLLFEGNSYHPGFDVLISCQHAWLLGTALPCVGCQLPFDICSVLAKVLCLWAAGGSRCIAEVM
jgi:hypothetical protein